MSKLKKSLTKYLNDKLSHNECYSEVVEKANLQKKYKENVFYMKKSFLKIALPCILGLCLIVGVVLGITLSKKNVEKSEPTAVVQMDVNPSVSFVVDNNGKVVSIYGENDEGKMILTGETFTGLKLEVAIEKILNEESKTGYIVNISGTDSQKISFNIECETVAISDELEAKIRDSVEKTCEKLKIKEKIEIAKTQTKEALVKRAMELDPTLTEEAANAKSIQELVSYIMGCQIEKINIPTKELENLYNQVKMEKINIVEREETKKVIDTLDSTYQKIIAKYDDLYKKLGETNKTLDELYYEYFIKETSDYQKALKYLQEQKAALLKFKNELAEMDDSNLLKPAKQAQLTVYVNAVAYAEEGLESAKKIALSILETTKNTINSIMEEMDKVKAELPEEIKTSLTAHLTDVETKVNEAKDNAFKTFEEEYKEDLTKALAAVEAYKAQLVKNLKK